MVASSMKSSFIAVATLLCSTTFAARPVGRQNSANALDPWVTVDASGKASTVTPVLTTINGVATTISPLPAILTTTTTAAEATGNTEATTTASGDVPQSTGGGSFQICHNTNGAFAPFCTPGNGSSVYVGQTYYVTWDTSYFGTKDNSTVLIQANYVNASGGGPQAFQSPITPNNYGFIAWTIDKAWLKGSSSNNITLFIVPLNPTSGESTSVTGPTLEVTNEPPPPIYHQPPTPAPTARDLYIALPTVLGFIFLCLVGGCLINRKRRAIGLGNVMGRRKGYATGKSRAQRLGLKKNRGGAISLRDQELTADGQYRDVPEPGARATGNNDRDDLGSLAGTPTEDRTNYFRDEMRRQEQQQNRF